MPVHSAMAAAPRALTRSLLVAFYRHHDPSKLGNIDAVLVHPQCTDAFVHEFCLQKYGATPTPFLKLGMSGGDSGGRDRRDRPAVPAVGECDDDEAAYPRHSSGMGGRRQKKEGLRGGEGRLRQSSSGGESRLSSSFTSEGVGEDCTTAAFKTVGRCMDGEVPRCRWRSPQACFCGLLFACMVCVLVQQWTPPSGGGQRAALGSLARSGALDWRGRCSSVERELFTSTSKAQVPFLRAYGPFLRPGGMRGCAQWKTLVGENRLEPEVRICLDDIRPPCNVLSIGIDYNFIFDDFMLTQGCTVWSFDPSMKKSLHGNYARHPNHRFFHVGIGPHDGTFHGPSTLYTGSTG